MFLHLHACTMRACSKCKQRTALYGPLVAIQLHDHFLWCGRVSLNTASKGKYAQVLAQIGGYAWLQRLLAVLHGIAESHGVSIADIASRWVLDKPAVGAVILGAVLTRHLLLHWATGTGS